MKNGTADQDAQQYAYLLEYDRRRILDCADTFQSLASVFYDMNREMPEAPFGDRELVLRKSEAKNSRRQYAFYMQQMAGFMQNVAGTSVRMVRLGGRREKQILRALAGEGIWAQDIYLLRGQEDWLEISLSVCTKQDTSVTAAQIGDYLSVLMDIRLISEKRNPYFVGKEEVSLYYREEPAFCCMSAAAVAVMENESVSGDSYSFYEEDGRQTMILSDGVGSGKKAAADSSRIVELTEQILEAGLGSRMAVQLMDTMAGVEGDETAMATLDVCRIDLCKGECAITKAGAASTFIKKGVHVEKIRSSQLPLGLLLSESGRETLRPLADGDMVIAVSDGVISDWPCGDGEFLFARQIERLHASSPQDMANLLLKYAIAQCRGKIRDDMTVLVTGIWENNGEEAAG